MAFVNGFGHGSSIARFGAAKEEIDTIRTGEDARLLRRSLRLLCGGWLPHDDGASEGCLALATDVGLLPVQHEFEDPLYRAWRPR